MDSSDFFSFAEALVDTALCSGAESAEVYFSESFGRKFHYQDRELERMGISEEQGFSLRISSGGRQGFAYRSSMDKEGVIRMIEEALASAGAGDEPSYDFSGPVDSLPEITGLEDHDFYSRDRRVKVDLIENQIEKAYAVSPKVKRIKRAAYGELRYSSGLVTSEGFKDEKKGTIFTLGCSVMAKEGQDSEVSHEWTSARIFENLMSTDPAVEAADRAVKLLGGGTVKTGRYTVLLHPSVACSLISVFAGALSGEMVARGKSRLAGKIGEKVAPSRISLVDDGLMCGGNASSPFDDEGVPQRRAFIIRNGVLEGYLLNLKSAGLLGMEPSGNGRRADCKSFPKVRPANLHIRNGSKPVDELMGELASGLFVVDVLGAHTMDPVSGTVSLGASGFVISKGAIERPFRGVTIAGNLYEMFQRIENTGNDIRFYGDVGSPSLLLEDVDVAGQS